MFSQATQALKRLDTARRRAGGHTSLVRKPNLCLYLDGGSDFLGNADLWRYRIYSMVISDGRHLAFAVASSIWNSICTVVSRWPAKMWKRSEGSRGEGREEI